MSSIHIFGARALSLVFLQLLQEALLFWDFRPFSAIVFLPTAVLVHDPAVSLPSGSHAALYLVSYLVLTHSPYLYLQLVTRFQIQRRALMFGFCCNCFVHTRESCAGDWWSSGCGGGGEHDERSRTTQLFWNSRFQKRLLTGLSSFFDAQQVYKLLGHIHDPKLSGHRQCSWRRFCNIAFLSSLQLQGWYCRALIR